MAATPWPPQTRESVARKVAGLAQTREGVARKVAGLAQSREGNATKVAALPEWGSCAAEENVI